MHASGGLCQPPVGVEVKELQHGYNPATALYTSTLQAYAAHVGNPMLAQQTPALAPWGSSMAPPYGYQYPPGFVPPYYPGAPVAVPRWGVGAQPGDVQHALSSGAAVSNGRSGIVPFDAAALHSRSASYNQRFLSSQLSAATNLLGGPVDFLKPNSTPHYSGLSGCTVPSLSTATIVGDKGRPQSEVTKQTTSVANGTASTTHLEELSSRSCVNNSGEDHSKGLATGNIRDELVMKLVKGDRDKHKHHPSISNQVSDCRPSSYPSETVENRTFKSSSLSVGKATTCGPSTSVQAGDVHNSVDGKLMPGPSASAAVASSRNPAVAAALKRKLGEQQYYRVRAKIVAQQECFVHQLFELHKLCRLQTLLWTELQHSEYSKTVEHTQNCKGDDSRCQSDDVSTCQEKFAEDIQVLLNIPKNLRKNLATKSARPADPSRFRVDYSRTSASIVYPQASRLACPSDSAAAPTHSLQATVQQPTQSAKRVPEASSLRFIGSEVQSSFQKVTPRKSAGRDELGHGREQAPQRSLDPPAAPKGSPSVSTVPAAPSVYTSSAFQSQQQFGGCYVDPHQAWYAKHYEGRQYSGVPALPTQSQVKASSGPPQPAPSSGTASKEPSKVQHWWQDPVRTFGEPALIEPDCSKARAANEKHSSGQRVDTQKLRSSHQKGGSVFLPPLKKRAKYDCHPVDSAEQAPESCALQSSEGKAPSTRPQLSKEKKRPFGSAFKPVQQRSIRSKRGSNRLTRDESVASDNSASSCDKGASKNVHRDQPKVHNETTAQSAKSAAGILMSMCSSFNNS